MREIFFFTRFSLFVQRTVIRRVQHINQHPGKTALFFLKLTTHGYADVPRTVPAIFFIHCECADLSRGNCHKVVRERGAKATDMTIR